MHGKNKRFCPSEFSGVTYVLEVMAAFCSSSPHESCPCTSNGHIIFILNHNTCEARPLTAKCTDTFIYTLSSFDVVEAMTFIMNM